MVKKGVEGSYRLASKPFCTYDLGCSAALISAGFELISLDRENPRKVQFIFRREGGIEKVVNDYWTDKL